MHCRIERSTRCVSGNDSLIELAKGPARRRQRFLRALHEGGDFLFSWTNAIEIAGPMGKSAAAIRNFLDGIGPHWTPLELNPWKVVRREADGFPGQAPVSESFIQAYFQERAYDLSPGGCKVLELSADSFFNLSAVLDWAQKNRDDIRRKAGKVDLAFCSHLRQLREDYEKNQSSLDRKVPSVGFAHERSATFVRNHLLRMLVLEAKAFQYKKNDGLDFCHAVLATAYRSAVTLDKQWKRRVESLSHRGQLAKVY